MSQHNLIKSKILNSNSSSLLKVKIVFKEFLKFSVQILCQFLKQELIQFMLKEFHLMPLIEKLLVNIINHFIIILDIFRPFPGFKSVRLIPREKKPGEKVIFCFADFENAFQTTLVINTL